MFNFADGGETLLAKDTAFSRPFTPLILLDVPESSNADVLDGPCLVQL